MNVVYHRESCYLTATFGTDHHAVCKALLAEGIRCSPGYTPMNRYDLFQPQLSKLPVPSAFPERFHLDEIYFDTAERMAQHEAIFLGEATFRAGKAGVDDVVNALKKVQAHAQELARLE